MRGKLLDLMKNEGLKPSQLAEMLEINPAGISHILAGRNKPGFDLLQKILRRFPQINPDWLMLDSTKMYRDEAGPKTDHSSISRPSAATAGELFGVPNNELPLAKMNASTNMREVIGTAVPNAHPTSGIELHDNAAVERVVIFYEDQSFESFTPRRGLK